MRICRVRIKLYFAIAFALTLMVMMSSTVSAATITVDDSGGEDHTTIQAAINAANDSDTILVYSGTYTENVDVNKSLIIISQSGNPDDTNVQASNSNNHVFNVTRDNVTISGFNVTGATVVNKAGIFLDEVQNNTISDNKLSNNYFGIYLLASSNNTLNNNTASDNDRGIRVISSSNNTLNNNTANSNNFGGIWLEDSSNNNTLTNNTA
ncbi:MAG: right-handed parallel beta-helix repeat-containing protein, partial [Thermoplasmatales archaeon]|nr:right-handed parallel beta-helix repeat-containing protein [Thermoplasmatales archaeon]